MKKFAAVLPVVLALIFFSACAQKKSANDTVMAAQYLSPSQRVLVPPSDPLLDNYLTVIVRSGLKFYNQVLFASDVEPTTPERVKSKEIGYHNEPYMVRVLYTMSDGNVSRRMTSEFFCENSSFHDLTIQSSGANVLPTLDGVACKPRDNRISDMSDLSEVDSLDRDQRYDIEPRKIWLSTSGNPAFRNATFQLVTAKGKISDRFTNSRDGDVVLPNPGGMKDGYTVTVHYQNGNHTVFEKTNRTGSDKDLSLRFAIQYPGTPVMDINNHITVGPRGIKLSPD